MGKKILVLPEVYDEVYTGGPLAVVKKMYDLDKKNFDYIRVNKVILRENICNKSYGKKIIEFVSKKNFIRALYTMYKIYVIKHKLVNINVYKYDVVISHDILHTFVLLKYFQSVKVINIYHGQGSLYYEFTDLVGVNKGIFLRKLFSYIERYVYLKSYKIGFPSRGSIEALIGTNNELKKIIEKRKNDIIIFYNGVNLCPNIKHNTILEKKIIKDGYNFVTIASLNEAKGVDRIPQFLGFLKRKGIKFSWTLVGKGKLSNKIKNEISKNNIKNETNFLEKGFPKEEILGLLSKTDFYILFHRFSIFDLATLEAMNFGNIPILSNVGGNKEVIKWNNGLLFDESNIKDITLFLNYINNNDIDRLKEKNRKIIYNYFSDNMFINKYKEVLNY